MSALEIINVFDRAALERIAAVRGASLMRTWGPFLHRHATGLIMSTSAVIDTGAGPVALAGNVVDLGNWEGSDGGEAEYGVIEVADSLEDVYPGIDPFAEAERRSHVYFNHRGELIEDVLIFRETVSQCRNGEHRWDYTTDTAVAFVLARGVLAVSKAGLNDENLVVTFAESLSSFAVPEPESPWFHWQELGIEFSRRRNSFRIDELLVGDR